MHIITYHLSRSALMLAQAAGTGASAGAAAVSESDMSVVVLLCGLRVRVLSCSCPPNAYGSKRHQQRETETVQNERELVKGEGAKEEVGGDKTCDRAVHVCTQRLGLGGEGDTKVKGQ